MVICFCTNNETPFLCSVNSTCKINGYCYSSQQIIYNKQNGSAEIKRVAGCLHNNESGFLHVSLMLSIVHT